MPVIGRTQLVATVHPWGPPSHWSLITGNTPRRIHPGGRALRTRQVPRVLRRGLTLDGYLVALVGTQADLVLRAKEKRHVFNHLLLTPASPLRAPKVQNPPVTVITASAPRGSAVRPVTCSRAVAVRTCYTVGGARAAGGARVRDAAALKPHGRWPGALPAPSCGRGGYLR